MLLATPRACSLPSDGKIAADAAECESVWYADADSDGFGGASMEACDAPAGYAAAAGDCDDTNAAVSPTAPELCDGVDQDCDDEIDEGLPTIEGWPDRDGDGFGAWVGSISECALPEGWVANEADCDDAKVEVNPDALERCNGYDDDCDGLVDLDDAPVVGLITYYPDSDADGYGTSEATITGCDAPPGYAAEGADCDDADAAVNPASAEVCLDFIDQDCDGYTDDYTGDCAPDNSGSAIGGCDPSVIPVDVSLCVADVAAVLPSGTTYATVQSAIDAAIPGDIVTVCPGTWSESLSVSTPPLSLAGFGAGTSVLTSATGGIIDIASGGELTVVDLTITGGEREDGGGIYGRNATLCVARAAFQQNFATYCGGGISMAGDGSLTIDESTFSENVADYCGGGIEVDDGYVLFVEDSTFIGNSAGYQAGGFEINGDASGTIRNTTFDANDADYEGGVLDYSGNGLGGTLTLDSVLFTDNDAGHEGGAVSLGAWDWGTVICVACTFTDNTARVGGGAVDRGSWGGATFIAYGSTFTDNTGGDGGALALDGWGEPVAALADCTFDGNTALEDGGAIAMSGRGIEALTIVGSTLTNNTGARSGGVSASTDGTLTSIDSDWGSGGTDNDPSDVSGYSYGAGASFVCTAGSCR